MAKGPAGKREQNKQANLAAILRAARECFLEWGYDAVTIRDVIRRTGLASGTFYNYFRDKETLFRALVEDRIRTMTGRVSALRRSATSVDAFLLDAYTAVLEEICSDPDFYVMLFRNEAIVRSLYGTSALEYSVQALKADLRDAIARRLIPEIDVDYMTAVMFGAGYELARLLSTSRDRNPRAAAVFVTRLFLGGVLSLAPEPKLLRRGSLTLGGSAR